MKFPTTWPQSCPPDDASQGEIWAYRVVSSNPPTMDDFQTYQERGRAQKCQAYGLSLLEIKEAAMHHIRLFPQSGNWVAELQIGGNDRGLWKKTPSQKQPAHLTWWIPSDFNRMEAIQDTFQA